MAFFSNNIDNLRLGDDVFYSIKGKLFKNFGKNENITNIIPKLINVPNFIHIEQWESVQYRGGVDTRGVIWKRGEGMRKEKEMRGRRKKMRT